MAIEKEQLQEIAKRAGIDVTVLEKAVVEKDVVKLELKPVKVFTDEEYATLTANTEKNGYDKGAIAGREMLVKDLKEKTGLNDLQGKDPDSFITAYKTKLEKDLKIPADQKVIELSETIKKLQGTVVEQENIFNTKEQGFNSTLEQIKIDSILINSIPKVEGNFSPAEIATIIKANYEIKLENGVPVAYQNGVKVVDNIQNPVPVKSLVEKFVTEKFKVLPEGRGAGDGGSGGSGGDYLSLTTNTQFQEWADKKGLSVSERVQKLQEIIKKNPNFKRSE